MKILLASFLCFFIAKGFIQEAKIKSFSISECINNCQLQSHIDKVEDHHELYISGIIKLNCCGNFKGEFEIIGSDTLNVIVKNDQNDSKKIQGCDCICSYSINMELSNCVVKPSVVLINNETIEDNDKKGGIQKDIDLK